MAARRADVDAFVKAQETRQVFAPLPKSNSKVTSTSIDGVWQVDLIDFKQLDATKNDGHRVVLVVIDVFSRFARAVPLKGKTQAAVTAGFQGILT